MIPGAKQVVFLMLLPGFEAKDNITKYTQTPSLSPLFPSQRKMCASLLVVVLEELYFVFLLCIAFHFLQNNQQGQHKPGW